MAQTRAGGNAIDQLYTAEQRRRRDASRWTLVQGILAPVSYTHLTLPTIQL